MNGFDISTISGIYVGSTPYSAIYKGSTLVWSAIDYSKEYLTIESLEDNNEFKLIIVTPYGSNFTYSERVLYYSKDKQNWTSITATTQQSSEATTITTLNRGEKLYLKSTNNGLGMNNGGRYGGTNIYLSGTFNVYGNIMSLLYGDNFVNQTTLPNNYSTGGQYNFYGLFTRSKVVDATNLILPATRLANMCYANMFQYCTSLTTTPELPATTLESNCYSYMFYGCTSLTTAPELPATTLTNYCYEYMFYGCTSLTTAPELSSTTLAENCYQYMFKGCTSLTTAPELSASTLKSYCYRQMFQGCTSLTTAPVLSSTTLAEYCYANMFYGCTSLTTTQSILPATTLANYCYSYMFYGCTSLVKAPELPATTLANYCYQYMFRGCTSLVEAPELPATTLANSCYRYMFYGCTSLIVAPELPATTLADYCYGYMFQSCTSLTTAPELKATTLVSNCYRYMFNGCTNLTYVKALFTTDITSSSSTYTMYWLQSVAASGTFIKSDSATWSVTGDNGVPNGWSTYQENLEPFIIVSKSNSNTISIENTLGSSFTLYYNGASKTISSSGTTTITTLSNNGIIRITANTSSYTRSSSKYITIKATGDFIVQGNVMALLYSTNINTRTSVGSYQFYNLFKDNTYLKDASGLILPATTINSDAYDSMFRGCTSLVTPPRKLPATLSTSYMYQYNHMFDGCTSLITAPKLPSTTLSVSCYGYMFKGCTSLVKAPELLGTTLSNYCYQYMFDGCTSLTTPPVLQATTLKTGCYYYMFRGCTSLTTAPELPATTLVSWCYEQMFYGCTSLNQVVAMFTTDISSTTSYTQYWLAGVSSTGTFYKNVEATWSRTGESGVPSGWTIIPVISVIPI